MPRVHRHNVAMRVADSFFMVGSFKISAKMHNFMQMLHGDYASSVRMQEMALWLEAVLSADEFEQLAICKMYGKSHNREE